MEKEDVGEGAGKDYDDLLEEIAELKAELEDRPTQEEVCRHYTFFPLSNCALG